MKKTTDKVLEKLEEIKKILCENEKDDLILVRPGDQVVYHDTGMFWKLYNHEAVWGDLYIVAQTGDGMFQLISLMNGSCLTTPFRVSMKEEEGLNTKIDLRRLIGSTDIEKWSLHKVR